MSTFLDIVMELAAWGMLATALVGTLLGLLAQLIPASWPNRAPSAVPAREGSARARTNAGPAPRSAGLRPVPGRACVARIDGRVCVPA